MNEGGGESRQIGLFDEPAPVAPVTIAPPVELAAEIAAHSPSEAPPPRVPQNPLVDTAPAGAEDKDPQAFRTIGEVAKALSIAPHVLRYWEEQFPMLRPVKRSGSRRYYRPEDIQLLERIDRLVHGEAYTLRGARKLLEAEARQARQAGRRPQAVPQSLADNPGVDGGAPSANMVQGLPPQTLPPQGPPAQDLAKQLRAIRATLAEALRAS